MCDNICLWWLWSWICLFITHISAVVCIIFVCVLYIRASFELHCSSHGQIHLGRNKWMCGYKLTISTIGWISLKQLDIYQWSNSKWAQTAPNTAKANFPFVKTQHTKNNKHWDTSNNAFSLPRINNNWVSVFNSVRE